MSGCITLNGHVRSFMKFQTAKLLPDSDCGLLLKVKIYLHDCMFFSLRTRVILNTTENLNFKINNDVILPLYVVNRAFLMRRQRRNQGHYYIDVQI